MATRDPIRECFVHQQGSEPNGIYDLKAAAGLMGRNESWSESTGYVAPSDHGVDGTVPLPPVGQAD